MRGYFVTGTDTEVGKTTVSVALLAAGTARGLRTRCLKPAESGCARGADGVLVAADARALWAATDREQSLASAVVYVFEEPVAPGVAAERAGVVMDFERIGARLDELAHRPVRDFATEGKPVDALGQGGVDLILVEGAGGLLVPMGQGRMIADLAQFLGLPLLVVARPGLGTINHTLLTIEAARSRGLEVAAVVFSAGAGGVETAAVASNAEEIERASGVPVVGCLPHVAALTPEALGPAAESSLDLARLLPRR